MYKVLKKQSFQRDNYSIVPLRRVDIMPIKDWRNHQIDILRQSQPLTDDQQVSYFENQVVPTFEELTPTIILFSFFKDSQLIGYGGLTNNDWINKHSEISFLISTERKKDKNLYHSDFLHFLELMKEVAFADLGFNRLFTETFDIRPLHISILEESGFRLEGRLKEHVMVDGRFVDSLIHGYLHSYDRIQK